MKFPGDVRKLKKLDIKVSYRQNLMAVLLIFDNLITKLKGESRKRLVRALIIKELWRLCRKTPYSLKGIETFMGLCQADFLIETLYKDC